jgi:hypothetical protein
MNMNYINRLQDQTLELQHALITRAERTQEFLEHLASAKFNGVATDGSRTDWISTADVQRWLQYINSPAELEVSQ